MSIPKKRGPEGGHYFAPEPEVASAPRPVAVTLAGRDLTLQTDRGVFSANRLDHGTAVLLEKAPAPPLSGDLLDLGCGYGPIGIWLGLLAPRAKVWAVDVNARAVELAALNARAAGISQFVACTPEEVPVGIAFASIYSNPPVHVGKAELHRLLLHWLPRLAPGGSAWLVVQHHLGSDSLLRWLGEQGFEARKHASKKGYRVLEVSHSPAIARLDDR